MRLVLAGLVAAIGASHAAATTCRGGGAIGQVWVAGRPMLAGSVCKPGECPGNDASILFTPDQRRVVGFVRVDGHGDGPGDGKITMIGKPSGDELTCLLSLPSGRPIC
jgi:hypothetical protein